jgi:hypothetical protein
MKIRAYVFPQFLYKHHVNKFLITNVYDATPKTPINNP